MKKLLFLIFCSFSSLVMAQVTVTTSPKYGCPNTTHNVTVSVTNTSGVSIPAGSSYTIDLALKNDVGTSLKTYNQTFTDGFPDNTTKNFVIVAVPFPNAMTCTVEGTFSGSFPIPFPPYTYAYNFAINENYVVKLPPNLTITESMGTLNVSTALDGYSVRYYLNSNFTTVINQSTTGTYTAVANGDYSAKGFDPISSCISTSASNTINVVVTTIQDAQHVSISVYPNPVISSITIEAGASYDLSYELSDMNGAIVRSASFNGSGNVNTADLNTGSYVLVVKKQNEKIASYKLVK